MVFFRLPLAAPHLVWLILWGIVVFLAAVVNWFITLFRGRSATALHRFNSAYVRYQTHVYAFFELAANPFPGFTGKAAATRSTSRSLRPSARTVGSPASG